MKQDLFISCPSTSRSGYGDHSRDLIRSLIAMDKYNITIIDQRWGDCPQDALGDDDYDIMNLIYKGQPNTLPKKPVIWVQVTVPNEFQPVGNYNIGVTAGIETTAISGEWIEGCNRMDTVIVPSEHSKNAMLGTRYDKIDKVTQKNIGEVKVTVPVKVLFEGLDTTIFDKNKNIVKLPEIDSIPEQFCFLVCGHWLKGDFGHDRKDIASTIRNFIETFKNTGNKRPALILKTSGAGFSVGDREEILRKLRMTISFSDAKNPPNIYFLHGDMTQQELNSLYNHPKVKAMVSFTHGEGFGRPLMEFSITGKPVIVSGWSGHLDFMSKYGIMLKGRLETVHQSAAWNKVILKDSKWFYVDQGYASSVLKEIWKNYKRHLERTRKQTKYVKDNFTLEHMTKEFENILSIVPKQEELLLSNLPKLKKLEKANG